MSQSLDDLAPQFKPLVEQLLGRLDEEGIEYQILWTTRTKLEQAKLYGEGRFAEATTGFTRNKPGDSFHNYGMAIDLMPVAAGRIDSGNKALINRIGEMGKECGLLWGGEFIPAEIQHFQMPGMTLNELKTGKKEKKRSDELLDGMIDGIFA